MDARVHVLPALAMALLTFAVWLRLFFTRIPEMKRRRIHPQSIALSAQAAAAFQDTRAADNFRNLFELPVLFFAGVLAALATGAVDAVLVGLACVFVALRAMHSLVHCTWNRVMHRFLAYAASAVALWAMWVRLALAWLA